MSAEREGELPVEIDEIAVVGESDKAIMVQFDDGSTRWVPKSVIHDNSEAWKKDDQGMLIVKAWWAERNGFV